MKKTNKLISVLLVTILSVMLFAGCSYKKEEVPKENATITVEDQLGRKVEIKGEVNRIVSSYYVSTSMLIGLGVQDKVVGIEKNAKNREMYKKVAPEFLELPGVGTGKEINVEECMNLNPDLVIIPTRLQDFIPQFEELGIPVLAIEPEDLDNFMNTVKMLGTAIGAEEKSNEFIKYYEDTLTKVNDLTNDVENKPNVYLGGTDSILKTCTSKMYQNYMFEVSGANNVTSELTDGYWTNISVEQLIKYNPDYIYIVGYASYGIDDVLNDSRLQDINAVKNKNVYIFPSTIEPWDYPTPSSILGMLWTTSNLHSDIYSVDSFKKDAKEFYKDFFNLEVSDEEIGL